MRRVAWAVAGIVLAGAAGSARAEETPRRGGTLVYAVNADPSTYDCHATFTFSVLHYVAPHYSTLLKFDPNAYPDIVGDLAESWEVAPDNLTYTFRLRPGVTFHDGTALSSADIKATYERIKAPPPGVVSLRQETLARVAAIDTPDERTVIFRMSEPDAAMPAMFASPWNCVYSAAKLKQDPTFPAKNVLGTGPFAFVEHVAGSHWTGKRHDGYFRPGHPYLDGFRAVSMSGAAVVNAVQGGQIMAEFRGFTPAERDRLKAALGDKVRIYEEGAITHNLLVFNAERKPFDDVRVRRALNLAIDRWGGAQALGKQTSSALVGGLLRPGGPWSASSEEMAQWPGFGRDAAAARAEAVRLLREAGAEKLSFRLVNRNVQTPYTQMGIYLVDQWRRIGVTAEHVQLESGAWTSSLSSGQFEVAIDAYSDYVDEPTSQLTKYISSDRSPLSFGRWHDKELDALFDKQRQSFDKAERSALLRRMETRMFEQSWSVPLLWSVRTIVTDARLKGWPMSPSLQLFQDLGDAWLAE
jgi:peptide/nickel transport system substrate-binding protein